MLRFAFALGLLGLVAIAGTAHAVAWEPPGSVVGLVERVITHSSPPGSYQSDLNVTWRLSANDPDQVNGTYNYTVWLNTTSNSVNGGCNPDSWNGGFCSGWLPFNFTKSPSRDLGDCQEYAPLPQKAGWVGGKLCSVTWPQQPGNIERYAINVTSWDGPTSSATPSIPSCTVNLTASFNGKQDQCGAILINGTTGVSGLVTQVGTGKYDPASGNVSNTIVEFRWNTSLDDPLNTTQGNLTYFFKLAQGDINLTVGYPGCICGPDTTDANDANGIRFRRQHLGAEPQVVSFAVIVIDPFTHQWSNMSCAISISTDQVYRASACGTMGSSNGLPGQEGPSFPFLNVESWQESTGLTTDEVGWYLGAVLLLALTVIAFMVHPIAGVVVGILCIPLLYTLSLIPAWWLIIIFMLASLVFVVSFSKGSSA